jgi:hypothetical protein
VTRALSSALVVALLAATAAAFVITERAKLERSPIYGTKPPPHEFSPKGSTVPAAAFSFQLRSRETVEVWMKNSSGRRVRTVLPPHTFKARTRIRLAWNGLNDNGILVPDGGYSPVVKLKRSHWTIALPNHVRLDTVPPSISVGRPPDPILSPDGDHRGDTLRVSYRINEPAQAILYVDGARAVLTQAQKLTGILIWNGTAKRHGVFRPLPPGRFVLAVAARDRAGNVSRPLRLAIAHIRYVAVAPSHITVRPRERFAMRVSTDAPKVRWKLHGQSGVKRRGTVHLRAPAKKGAYSLYVIVRNHAARARVVVR